MPRSSPPDHVFGALTPAGRSRTQPKSAERFAPICQAGAGTGGPPQPGHQSASSSVTRLPITRTMMSIKRADRMPTGPASGRNRGSVSSRPSRRATENPAAVVLLQQRRPGCRGGTGITGGQELRGQPPGLQSVVDALAVGG